MHYYQFSLKKQKDFLIYFPESWQLPIKIKNFIENLFNKVLK